MTSGWLTEARSIEEKKWTQACGMQKQQLGGTLGLLWKRVDKMTSLDTKIDNEALTLAVQSQVSFTNVEWDELKVYDTVMCTSYISSGKLFFKTTLLDKPAGTVGGSESEIAGSLVQDFWTAIEYGGVPEFLGRLRNRGHRLMARWGEEILLETSGNQNTLSLISGLKERRSKSDENSDRCSQSTNAISQQKATWMWKTMKTTVFSCMQNAS